MLYICRGPFVVFLFFPIVSSNPKIDSFGLHVSGEGPLNFERRFSNLAYFRVQQSSVEFSVQVTSEEGVREKKETRKGDNCDVLQVEGQPTSRQLFWAYEVRNARAYQPTN